MEKEIVTDQEIEELDHGRTRISFYKSTVVYSLVLSSIWALPDMAAAIVCFFVFFITVFAVIRANVTYLYQAYSIGFLGGAAACLGLGFLN